MAPRHLLLTLLAAGALSAADAQEPAVRVDPRIELTTIVFRLIGADEYNQCQLPGYAADIDRYFASFREHPALKLAAQLREARNIGFDAVPHLALALTDPPELAERLDIGPGRHASSPFPGCATAARTTGRGSSHAAAPRSGTLSSECPPATAPAFR